MATHQDEMVQLCADAHADPTAKSLGCSGCVKFFDKKKFKVNLPDVRANELIDHMAKNWTEVTKDEAQKHADAGRFVVAGKAETTGSGHVVVVLPGGPVESGGYNDRKGRKLPSKGKYPRSCSMSSSANPWPGAISTGDKSTYDPWFNDQGVKYWLAPLPAPETKSAAKKGKGGTNFA